MKTFTFKQFINVIVTNMCTAFSLMIHRTANGQFNVQFDGHPAFPCNGKTMPMAITRKTEAEVQSEMQRVWTELQLIGYSRNGKSLFEEVCKASKKVVDFGYDNDPVDANVAQFARAAAGSLLASINNGKLVAEYKCKHHKVNGKPVTIVARRNGAVEVCTGGFGNLRIHAKGQAQDLTPYDDSDPEIQAKYRAHMFKRGADAIMRSATLFGNRELTPELLETAMGKTIKLAQGLGVSREDVTAHFDKVTVH